MNLTIWECKKIWKRRSSKIALSLALIYALFMGVWNGINNLAYRDSYGNIEFSGIDEVKNQLKWAEEWSGELISEKLIKAQEQYNNAYLPENITIFDDGSTGPTNEAWNKYIRPLGNIPDIIRRTFQWIPEYSSYYSLNSIPLEIIEDYYKQRDEIVSDYLKTQVPNDGERKIFIRQNSQIKTPFNYDWMDGQEVYLKFIGSVAMFTTVFLCIALAPLFAGEYQQNAASILLCSKFGRKKLALAKIRAAMIIMVVTYILSITVYVICQLFFVGIRGLDSPIQLIKPIATAPLSIIQSELFAISLGFLACSAIVSFTIMISAKMSSAFPVVTISLLVMFLPSIIGINVPKSLGNIIQLFPFVSDYSELFRTNIYHMFGLIIWSPYMLLIFPSIITIICLPMAKSSYEKRQA